VFTETTKAGAVVPVDPSHDSAAWDAACDGAGIANVPLHSARHTCSSLLARLGVPEHIRMQILGHSSATVTRDYTHITTDDARQGMDALGRLLA
jgi:integrase